MHLVISIDRERASFRPDCTKSLVPTSPNHLFLTMIFFILGILG